MFVSSRPKLTKSKIDTFVRQNLIMAHWIRLSLLCRCEWTRKSRVWYGNVSEQYLLSCAKKRHIVHAQDSCACTRFLCLHNILVHAQQSCACTGGARDQGWDPTKKRRGSGPGRRFFWVPALVPGSSSACTRVLCMHKSVVHAQESCACTRILGLKTNPCC